MIPSFFIVGAPKTGTSSLYQYLNEHQDVFMCPVKEPNYFSSQDIIHQNLYYAEKGLSSKEAYEKLFADVASEKAIGEASVSYLFYEKVPIRIKEAVPDAKTIIILRNPIDRGFSHYLMDSRLGYVNIPFEDIVFKKTSHELHNLFYQQFIELGFYFKQVKRYLDVFGKDNVKIFITEDLKKDTPSVVREIYEFLDVDPEFKPDYEKRYNIYRRPRNSLVRRFYTLGPLRKILRTVLPDDLIERIKHTLLLNESKPVLSQNTRLFLRDLYKEDIQKTARLTNRDLSSWLAE